MTEAWQPHFFAEASLYALLQPVAERFRSSKAWPDLAALNAMASELGLTNAQGLPLTFVQALPKPRGSRRRQAAQATQPSYEERIFRHGCVPTRRDNWHDFFNALVWATFPRSKAALNHRQILLQDPAVARSREQDRLAMFDEGGIIQLRVPGRPLCSLVFGHALFESHLLKRPDIYGMVYENKPADSFTALSRSDKLITIDRAFAAFIMEGSLWQPEERPARALLSTLDFTSALA